MGRQGRLGDQLRERVRAERERREWSQAEFAKVLTDKGINGVYPTTIAKIESGDRAVRIDELAAIADVFSVSVDVLLGRNTANDDLMYFASQLADLARKSSHSISELMETMGELLGDVGAYAAASQVDPSELVQASEAAISSLAQSRSALDVVDELWNEKTVLNMTRVGEVPK